MRRVLIGTGVALLSFLMGVPVTMLRLKPELKCTESSASQLAPDQASAAPQVDFAEVFRGFDFAGTRVVRDESDTCPFGETDAYPLPEVMAGWRTYVFHRRDSGDADSAFDALQARLELAGVATSVSSDIFSGGRIHPNFMLFQSKGYVGNVAQRNHRAVSNRDVPHPGKSPITS